MSGKKYATKNLRFLTNEMIFFTKSRNFRKLIQKSIRKIHGKRKSRNIFTERHVRLWKVIVSNSLFLHEKTNKNRIQKLKIISSFELIGNCVGRNLIKYEKFE